MRQILNYHLQSAAQPYWQEKMDLKLITIILMLFAIAFCTLEEQQKTNVVADEPETSFPRHVGNLNITSPMEQYMRDLYKEYASESGKLQYRVDKPTNVWCFPDKGEFLFYVLLTYSVAASLIWRLHLDQFGRVSVTLNCATALRNLVYRNHIIAAFLSHRCGSRKFPRIREKHAVCNTYTICLPVEFHG